MSNGATPVLMKSSEYRSDLCIRLPTHVLALLQESKPVYIKSACSRLAAEYYTMGAVDIQLSQMNSVHALLRLQKPILTTDTFHILK